MQQQQYGRINFKVLKDRANGSMPLVLKHYGIDVVGTGEQVHILCPFHDDERPSNSVNLPKGLWSCKAGSCGLSGGLLDFVHQMEARKQGTASLPRSSRTLAEICGIPWEEVSATRPVKKRAGGAKPAAPAAAAPSVKEGKSYSQKGDDTPGAEPTKGNRPLSFELKLDAEHPYVHERVPSPELATTFGLGYCSRGSMEGRLAIPIANAEGQTVAYAGRWAGPMDELPAGKAKYELPAGFHKGLELFNVHRVKSYKHLVVVEGYFGAIRLHGERFPAVGLMGSSISPEQIALLKEHCPKLRHITVMLDGDAAGREAADKVAAALARDCSWWVRIVTLPDGLQPDTVSEEELLRLLGRSS